MRFRHLMVTLVAFWMIGALLPAQASASDFRLRIEKITTDSSGAVTREGVVMTDATSIADLIANGGDGDQDETGGRIFVVLPGITLTMGQSKPLSPLPNTNGIVSEMSLFSLQVHSDGAAEYRLTLEDTGFPGPSLDNPAGTFDNTVQLNFKSSVTSLSSTTPVGVNVSAYALDSNAKPNLGNEQIAWGNIASNPMDVLAAPMLSGDPTLNPTLSMPLPLPTAPNYSMLTQISLNFAGAGDITFNQVSTLAKPEELVGDGTPEPASLMLISTGLFGLAGARRRYKQKRG